MFSLPLLCCMQYYVFFAIVVLYAIICFFAIVVMYEILHFLHTHVVTGLYWHWTTTKRSKAKTVWIIHGTYCISNELEKPTPVVSIIDLHSCSIICAKLWLACNLPGTVEVAIKGLWSLMYLVLTGHVILVAIIGTTILVPCLQVQSLQLIGRSGTRRWYLVVPGLWMSRRDFTTWQGVSVAPAMTVRPFNTLRPQYNGRHFTGNTFKRIFMNENVRISIRM